MISAIQKCMQIVDDHSKIELDIIVMYPDRIEPLINDNVSTVYHYMRMREIKGYYSLLSDIASFIRAYPNINYRYFVQATKSPEPVYDLLSFNPKMTESMIELGKQDAKAVVEMGPGASFKQFIWNHVDGKRPKSNKQI